MHKLGKYGVNDSADKEYSYCEGYKTNKIGGDRFYIIRYFTLIEKLPHGPNTVAEAEYASIYHAILMCNSFNQGKDCID